MSVHRRSVLASVDPAALTREAKAAWDSDDEAEYSVEAVKSLRTKNQQLKDSLDKTREKLREQVQTNASLAERLSALELDLRTCQQDVNSRTRVIDDLQFELRRTKNELLSVRKNSVVAPTPAAAAASTIRNTTSDANQSRVSERVREFQSMITSIQAMRDRETPGGGATFGKTKAGSTDPASLELMQKQLIQTQEMLKDMQVRLESKEDEDEFQRILERRNAALSALEAENIALQDKVRQAHVSMTEKEKKWMSLVNKLRSRVSQLSAIIRDQAFIHPDTLLPPFYDMIKEGIRLDQGPFLVQKGVLARVTVNTQGTPMKPKYYFAVFSTDSGVQLRWGSHETSFDGYSYSATIDAVSVADEAKKELEAVGEPGQLIASLVDADEVSRLINVRTDSGRFIVLVAVTASAAKTWKRLIEDALVLSLKIGAVKSGTATGRLSFAMADRVQSPTNNDTIAAAVAAGLAAAQQAAVQVESKQETSVTRTASASISSSRPPATSISGSTAPSNTPAADEPAGTTPVSFNRAQSVGLEDGSPRSSISRRSLPTVPLPQVPVPTPQPVQQDPAPVAPAEEEVLPPSPVEEELPPPPAEEELPPPPAPETEEEVMDINALDSEDSDDDHGVPPPADDAPPPPAPEEEKEEAGAIPPPPPPGRISMDLRNMVAKLPIFAGGPPRLGEKPVSAGFTSSIKAPLVKYTKNGKDKHIKHFLLNPDGTILWGDAEGKYKYQESVKSVVRGPTSEFDKTKVSENDLKLLFSVETSGKPLHLLAPDAETMDLWVANITEAAQRVKK